MATRLAPEPPRRSAPFDVEPGFCPDAGLWLYGNARLLGTSLASISRAFGHPHHTPNDMELIEQDAERAVLEGRIIVAGIHSPAHQRAAIVPLRWGAPRILVFSGGFHHHLGPDLREEPFRAARLWRYQFDAKTDLVISRRAPDKLPTFAQFNPTVDRLIERITARLVPGILFEPR
jgi:DNA processing protein